MIYYTLVMQPLGYLYLIEKFKLQVCDLLLKCYATNESKNRVVMDHSREVRYYSYNRTSFGDTWEQNLLFAIKHEGVNLEVLKAFFAICDESSLRDLILSVPTGAYYRRIWFFYELLTGKRLDIADVSVGNYVKAVDPDLQFACSAKSAKKVRRYRVLNNLAGDSVFCPMVRMTENIRKLNAEELKNKSSRILKQYPQDLLYRAVQYLYVKETKSSFAIERETPTHKKMAAFVALLKGMSVLPVTKNSLVDLQNRIVEERYKQRDWRTTQSYVGQTISPAYEKVHFVAVKPEDIDDIMAGFLNALEKVLSSDGCDPVIVAAVMSFAFVFIHPFEDGNGRIHRYLMHYVLARTAFSPENMIFPVSAVLLKKTREYDRMLETFSIRLLESIDYDMNQDGEISVNGDSVDFYRYIDFTPIVESFQRVIEETIETEWKVELDYLVSYDRIRKGMVAIVEMPEKKANQFILFVNQNNGTLSAAKRGKFPELSDAEVSALEKVICDEMRAAKKVESCGQAVDLAEMGTSEAVVNEIKDVSSKPLSVGSEGENIVIGNSEVVTGAAK